MKQRCQQFCRTLFRGITVMWCMFAVVVMYHWAESYWVTTHIQFETSIQYHDYESLDSLTWEQNVYLRSNQGGIILYSMWYRQKQPSTPDQERYKEFSFSSESHNPDHDFAILLKTELDSAEETWSLLGVYLAENNGAPPVTSWGRYSGLRPGKPQLRYLIRLPYWMVTTVVCAWPAIWGLLMRRNFIRLKRMAAGLCPKCKYDQRGSITAHGRSDTCPECGSATRLN